MTYDDIFRTKYGRDILCYFESPYADCSSTFSSKYVLDDVQEFKLGRRLDVNYKTYKPTFEYHSAEPEPPSDKDVMDVLTIERV